MNIYAYLRSKHGYGKECNLLAFPLSQRVSVGLGLTFVEIWAKNLPNWQSKDTIILFYEETEYSLSVKRFLEDYYDEERKDEFKTKVDGRCGYIRQAYVYNFPEGDFNKLSLYLDGTNSQLPDIDIYDATVNVINKNNLKVDLGTPYYFSRNPYL